MYIVDEGLERYTGKDRAKAIEEERVRRKITRIRMALKMKVSEMCIYQIERYMIKSGNTIRRLCDFLGVEFFTDLSVEEEKHAVSQDTAVERERLLRRLRNKDVSNRGNISYRGRKNSRKKGSVPKLYTVKGMAAAVNISEEDVARDFEPRILTEEEKKKQGENATSNDATKTQDNKPTRDEKYAARHSSFNTQGDRMHPVKELRKQLGISQPKLAALVGVHYSMISLIEAGLRRNVSIRTMWKIAKVFGVTLSDLVCAVNEWGENNVSRKKETALINKYTQYVENAEGQRNAKRSIKESKDDDNDADEIETLSEAEILQEELDML